MEGMSFMQEIEGEGDAKDWKYHKFLPEASNLHLSTIFLGPRCEETWEKPLAGPTGLTR